MPTAEENGPTSRIPEDRALRGATWSEDLRRDVRLGFRSLSRSPGFAAVAILCLALGIGANAAIFSVVNAVLLRPLPFPAADRLVRVYETYNQGIKGSASIPNYRDWQARSDGFEQLAAWWVGGATCGERARPSTCGWWRPRRTSSPRSGSRPCWVAPSFPGRTSPASPGWRC